MKFLVTTTGNSNAVLAKKIISCYLPVVPESLLAVLEGI